MNRLHAYLLLFAISLMSSSLHGQVFEDPDATDDTDGRKSESYVYIDPTGKKGFMFGGNIGYYLPNDEPADFYSGRFSEFGFLNLENFLQQPQIRTDILDALGNPQTFGYIPADQELLRYDNALLIGGHIRYQFDWYHAIVLNVDFTSLKMNTAFTLVYDDDNNTTQRLSQEFPIVGAEDRLVASLGYQINLGKPSVGGFHVELGPELTSVRVRRNNFTVAGRQYNLLRAQTIGTQTGQGNQVINNNFPTVSFIGAYVQPGFNIEFDKYTLDLGWRSSLQRIAISENLPSKYRLSHTPVFRFVYRLTIKGF